MPDRESGITIDLSLPVCPHLQAPFGHLQFSGPQRHEVPPHAEHSVKEKQRDESKPCELK